MQRHQSTGHGPSNPHAPPPPTGGAPWQENPAKVVLEFKKGTKNCKRTVQLSHGPLLPAQLQGRVAPSQWAGLVADCTALIDSHPHLAPATCACCAQNLFAALNFLVIGLGCFQADTGDYAAWLAKVQGVVNRWQPVFGPAGCVLSLQSVHGSYWVQCDITGPMSVQQPYAVPPPQQKPGYEAQGYAVPQPYK
mmetsp:Transcript_7911/g.16325  ORF Transcript_7911/g.16325 Transcript_7911/m.16325 type:complete len:193 (+) Transcript_7911:52-630(+)